jgi:hypothetical protein
MTTFRWHAGFDQHMTKPVEAWALEELLSNGNGR